MDKREKENWIKVRDALKEAGKIDCFFYKRAVAITEGKQDPLK